ncbi:MAG: 2-isopropylmalate synthase [Cycloclasticus sp. symbiont of Poecilosclerida sp. M]|nr:MAG: 2-isopropylmalate synthase [Cycloclasticus sp. symbiont of Poecilosclerida sp. M]
MSKEKLIIFDTTLRDGEQSPGAAMTADEKLRIAKALERMKVDVIEAGFPISSEGDFLAVQSIANVVKDSRICGLARTNKEDIERAGEALKNANASRIHTFIATSPLHMREKLQMEPEQVVEQAIKAVKLARQYTDDVEFSPEDAGRSELDFLCRIIEVAIEAGATTINIPDTVGYNLPEQYGKTIRDLIERVPNSGKAIFSTHCHNDLGLAVANSLAGVMNGARQVECSINGLGERAGNAAIEEVVMAIRTRQDLFPCDVDVDATQIITCSKLVSSITGFAIQPNKAIVGVNAFAHESGIHQDGVLKSRETYEIMRAQDVGLSSNKLVLGKLSGRSAFKNRLDEMGIELDSKEELNDAFRRFKELADKKSVIFDEDIQSLLLDVGFDEQMVEKVKLVTLKTCSETGETPHAAIMLNVGGVEQSSEASGGGAVDATFKAIEKIINSGSSLLLYSVNNVTEGTDSLGEVGVRLEKAGRVVNGHGSDTDIVMASAKAYIKALNKLEMPSERIHPQASSAI